LHASELVVKIGPICNLEVVDFLWVFSISSLRVEAIDQQ